MEQWGSSKQQVMAIISGALTMAPGGGVSRELEEMGYTAESRPDWVSSLYEPSGADKGPQETGRGPLEPGKGPQGALEGGVVPPGEGRGYAPAKIVSPSQVYSEDKEVPGPRDSPWGPAPGLEGPVTLSEEQQSLLAEHGVTYDAHFGHWVRTERRGRGYYSEIVDPYEALQAIEEAGSQDEILKRVGENMWGVLDVNTQAILRKVALNPSVFWGFQYVKSKFDHETGRA